MSCNSKTGATYSCMEYKKAALTNCIFCYGKVCFYFFMNSVLISLRIRSGYWTAISRNLRTFP